MLYLVKTPWWLQKLYPECTWQMPGKEKIIYLSFDDGPHPFATPFVLDELKKHKAKGTFFCIGKNVKENTAIYKRILDEGHAVGNHTHHHLNGWQTPEDAYLEDIVEAGKFIDSDLFRPPYGKATKAQLKKLSASPYQLSPIMWTVLSGDFDTQLSKEKCLNNVLNKTSKGSIIVFHDSEKAFEKLQFVLPQVLSFFTKKGYQFKTIKIE